jgi:hypothetical protein
MKRIVIVSDLQIPFHDRVAVKNVAQFITKFKPHEVVTIGDEIDFNTISKWSEGTPESYEQTLGDDRDEAVQVLYDLQVTTSIRSNHTDRLYNQIMRKIPSFLSLPELRFEKFMRFDELGITFHKKPYNIAPGWIAVHGDHTPIKSQGGLSALEAARRHGKSVISGHTHRAGRSSFYRGLWRPYRAYSAWCRGRKSHGIFSGKIPSWDCKLATGLRYHVCRW